MLFACQDGSVEQYFVLRTVIRVTLKKVFNISKGQYYKSPFKWREPFLIRTLCLSGVLGSSVKSRKFSKIASLALQQ